MSYDNFIKKDYKPADPAFNTGRRRGADFPRIKPVLFAGLLCFLTGLALTVDPGRVETTAASADRIKAVSGINGSPALQPEAAAMNESPAITTADTIPGPIADDLSESSPTVEPPEPAINWQSVPIKRGDNLSLIFDRLGLSPSVLHQVMISGEASKLLTRLMPGKTIDFHIEDGELQALRYEPDMAIALNVSRASEGYTGRVEEIALETRIRDVTATINDSMFLAGQDAGLSDNLIMRIVAIFGWDIDFALDIRSQDRFRVVYKELYRDGTRALDGAILAAEFINRGRTLRAVRYTDSKGVTAYYSDDGYSMRKAFLRTPVKFSRISSRFNPRRRHPVLNTIRAHRGVDYAAPGGTPVKATGDGTVSFAGRNGGYGNAVNIRHGGIYETVYAHLSRFGRGIKRGRQVRQGDIIGYVGQTGLASGPHLHYEFRVNGVHRNPLTVDLPKSTRIPEEQMQHFRHQVRPLLARLDSPVPPDGHRIALQEPQSEQDMVLALQEEDGSETTVH